MNGADRPKIAIIGTGISGLVAAHHLNARCDLSVFEKNDYIGGHTQTHDIEWQGESHRIDTGFIVFNDWTYPEFIRLMKSLGVEDQPSEMSFSVKCEKTGLEYNGTSLNALFAQRRNLFSPRFLGMISDIMRFNREAPAFIESGDDGMTLGEYLAANRYGVSFKDHYIIPMGAAIWSAAPGDMLDFPARFFIRFFKNHGMLSIDERPLWRVIRGGSKSYIDPLTKPFKDRIHLSAGVRSIRRYDDRVDLVRQDGTMESFDEVVLACHSDEAYQLLEDPSDSEHAVLGGMRYQRNETVLHTDTRILPRKKIAWAAWNYHVPSGESHRVAVTYNMNILQGLSTKETFCVTLNHLEGIDPDRIIRKITYHHPAYTPETLQAQARHGEISGVRRTHYAGAYWGFGFHEDGVKSGLRVANTLLRRLE
jgi:predicted NAD/FAD-binding protein